MSRRAVFMFGNMLERGPEFRKAALALVTGTAPSRLRTVDVGDGPDDAVFLLRLAVGLEAAMVALASGDADACARAEAAMRNELEEIADSCVYRFME